MLQALLAYTPAVIAAPNAPPPPPSVAVNEATVPDADMVSVSTPEQLAAAVERGALDIVISAHLDLRGLPIDNDGFQLPLTTATRSIRVRPHEPHQLDITHVNLPFLYLL
jgi:hypothetical protein